MRAGVEKLVEWYNAEREWASEILTAVDKSRMQKDSVFVRKISASSVASFCVSLAGVFVYLLHAFYLARTKTSFLDEGLYLYKGYLFATGQQIPLRIMACGRTMPSSPF